MIGEAWFKFNGIDSRQMGVIVTKMPATVRPKKRVESIEIPGRNGSLHTDECTFDSYDRTMECALKRRERLDEVAAWLIGSGDMIFSTEPNKVYRVMISNQISISQMMRMFQKFMVTMDTQPFKYSTIAESDTLEITEHTVVVNNGSYYSQPTITVYGRGDITLQINGEEFQLYGVDESITIDSEMMEVFKGQENQNSKYSSAEFPRLQVGENTISWTGEVEKVVIEPRWRWL